MIGGRLSQDPSDGNPDPWEEYRCPLFPIRGLDKVHVVHSVQEFKRAVPGHTAEQLEVIEDIFMGGTRAVRLQPAR